ncbi:hypothetical protein LHFGNBLO_006393 (plasmid) [Mesorhizobium sp. AR10]|uniref:hypothetical protein n=1 Tax=Mesorhizobium sp. AR10 TaxID=2865839 RepID=UPI0021604E95|nr:hypothetical protein [Mesorhizobium sp. AR10]UVK35590.1 hypothetical protein LHFGNBLO_006393 [Mesorhizobium sp. AR10]
MLNAGPFLARRRDINDSSFPAAIQVEGEDRLQLIWSRQPRPGRPRHADLLYIQHYHQC